MDRDTEKALLEMMIDSQRMQYLGKEILILPCSNRPAPKLVPITLVQLQGGACGLFCCNHDSLNLNNASNDVFFLFL